MLSICIPIYNFKVDDLVRSLSVQLSGLQVPAEIILIDDASNSSFRELNEAVCSEHHYIKLEKNIGRAAIRNRFLQYAKYEHLLFLDCDAIIPSEDFLSKYIDAIAHHPEAIICGGRVYPELAPDRSELLRWKYGVKKESQSAGVRKKDPNKSFMTNNFLVCKKIFEIIQFDERLIDYGHEDTLFGFELKKQDISIIHLNNPVLNGDQEKNEAYLIQTEKAIHNLVHILEFVNYDEQLIEDVSLLRAYYRFFRVRKPIKITFVVLKPLLTYFLSKGFVNLYLFDFYKLGILTTKMEA